MADIDALLSRGGAARAPRPDPAPEPKLKPRLRAVDAAGPDPDQLREQEEAQAAGIETAAQEFMAMLPAIKAARPLMPERGEQQDQLTGEEWVIEAWKTALFGGEAAAFGLDRRFSVAVFAREDAVIVEVIVPPELAGQGRVTVANRMIAEAARRQNLGIYEANPAVDKRKFWLVRGGAIDTTDGWSAQSKTAAFYRGGDYRRGVWDLAGLVQRAPKTGLLRYPQCEFRSGDRGGEVVLTLPPGMLPRDVIAAEPALRQALAMPQLTVDEGDGLHPVVRLNTKALVREFKAVNPLEARLFVRPRTMPERHTVPKGFVLPLGVREDGSHVLLPMDQTPHLGLYGETGSGKTVTQTNIIKTACLQSAAVVVADGKNGEDLKLLAKEHLPGQVAYFAGSDAAMFRALRMACDEVYRRAALSERLIRDDIKYQPAPFLLVADELGQWASKRIDGGTKAEQDAVKTALAELSDVAALGRETRCFIVVSGQHTYASALPSKLKENLTNLAVMGPPTKKHLLSLFDDKDTREHAAALGKTISKRTKGRGILFDQETEKVEVFQSYFTPPGPAEDAFNRELAQAPRLRRIGIRYPTDDEPGGDGTWQSWSPVSDPSTADLQLVHLDLPDGSPDPAMVRFDPTHRAYAPGQRRLNNAHLGA
ncbi:ftsk/SpoIIIE family protein, putative [Mycobacteroides abscessus subsp. abscessus]|uniref:hypothetical protein n=1 Tax=Mycobacteroides abscessus TaxID=36809 RepID=UPI0009A6399D|nr:hypothetical protein [Mycobacteroides abscessus]SKR41549.1 ftsk/SpoIIIE family protein, putative [Mycobacteroides abscessus subsp. abscessus]